MRVLDVGCGNGLFYDWLVEEGYHPDYWGVDASEEFLRQFKERHPEVEANLIQGFVTHPLSPLPLMVGALGGPFDVAVMFGIATDFGTDGTPKMQDLGMAVRNVAPLLRDGGALVADFWDEATFRPSSASTLDASELLRRGSVLAPPTAWDPAEVEGFFEGSGLRFEVIRPVVGRDFGIVAHKDGRRRADEQSAPFLAVFDFGDSLLADARRLSAAEVEKAVEEVAEALRRGAAEVRRSSRWQDRDASFAGPIVAAMESAASQVVRQWRTVVRSVGLGEGIAWQFDKTLLADIKDFGPDRVRKSVDAVSASVEQVIVDVAAATRRMSFTRDSGLLPALDGALAALGGEWRKVEHEAWS
jgi:SAM-dependent methyltransferase